MRRLRSSRIVVSLAAVLTLLLAPPVARAQAPDDAPRLAATLEDPEASLYERAKACQQLAVVGTADAVPALAALLPDEALNVYARFALEAIPDPAADAALRDAARALDGRPLLGVVSSLGQRRDRDAVELLAELAARDDAQLAEAALGALGRIGSTEAAETLAGALDTADAKRRSAAARAALAGADVLAGEGHRREALEPAAQVAEADVPGHLRAAAVDGQLRWLDGPDQAQLLVAQLRADDPDLVRIGLAAAYRSTSADVAEALTELLESGTLDDRRQALVLLAAGHHPQGVSLPLVLDAAQSDVPALREAAVQVLARLEDPAALAVLLETALGQGPAAELARQNLESLASPEVDRALAAELRSADPAVQVRLLQLVAARGSTTADAAVREALDSPQLEVRLAALAALGQVIELDEIELLVERALLDSEDAETAAARAALRTAALRAADREQAAALLAGTMAGQSAAVQSFVLELMGAVGGSTALKTVETAVQSPDPDVKDAATRVLGQWPNADAAAVLLEIARHDGQRRYQIRALRGYLRIARQLQLSDEQRLEMYQAAMQAAVRDEERQLAVTVLTRIPSPTTLQLATERLDDPALRNEAAEAVLQIGGRLVDQHPDAVARAMQQLLDAGAEGDRAARARQLLGRAQP